MMSTRYRIISLSLLAVAAIALLSIYFTRDGEPVYLSYIPQDAAGVVIVRRLPESIEELRETRLGGWIDFQSTPDSDSPEKEQFRKAARLFRENASHMLLCLHSIEKKESGSLRPELTLFLSAKRGRAGALADRLTEFALSRFGTETAQITEIGNTTIIRGTEKGQIFYLETSGGYIAASNSEAAWNQLQAVKNLPGGKRLMPSWYPIMVKEQSADVYIYFKGISGWAPRFVYSITGTAEGLTDSYHEF